jgi:hypothetical protein
MVPRSSPFVLTVIVFMPIQSLPTIASAYVVVVHDGFAQWLLSVAYEPTVAIPIGFAQQFCWHIGTSFGSRSLRVSMIVLIPVCLLSVMAYAYIVATCTGLCPYSCYPVCSCYPHWPSGLCGCYPRYSCYLYRFLVMYPSGFLFTFFTFLASGISGQAVGVAHPLLSLFVTL